MAGVHRIELQMDRPSLAGISRWREASLRGISDEPEFNVQRPMEARGSIRQALHAHWHIATGVQLPALP